MIILITLLTIFAVTVYLIRIHDDSAESDTLHFVKIFLIFAINLHLFFWLTASYRYEMLVTKKGVYEDALIEVRENDNKHETVVVLKKVLEWNEKLSQLKYQSFYLDSYIDDRIHDLEFINY